MQVPAINPREQHFVSAQLLGLALPVMMREEKRKFGDECELHFFL